MLLTAASICRVQGSTSSSLPSAAATSPIRSWDPSWAASCAQGTVVAVSYRTTKTSNAEESHGLVLLTRSTQSPTPTTTKEKDSAANRAVQVDGLRVLPVAMGSVVASDVSRRWTPLGATALCCMTGLASDVDYLSRALQKQADHHQTVYEASHHLATLKLVRALASMLQGATQWQGGRPYGVQAVLIGLDQQSLGIFSLDPSGGFRHWGAATAIGRGATQVRKHLYESLSQQDMTVVTTSGAEAALEHAMRACAKATKEASLDLNAEHYDAIVVRTGKRNGPLRVATVDPQQLRECQDAINKEMVDSPTKKQL